METTQTIPEVRVFCRKPGDGNLMHERLGKVVDGMFRRGEVFSIRPFENKSLPADVAAAMKKSWPDWILTDDEARAEQLKSEASIRERDSKIEGLESTLNNIAVLAARAAKGDKKAAAEIAAIISASRAPKDGEAIVKVVPPGPPDQPPTA